MLTAHRTTEPGVVDLANRPRRHAVEDVTSLLCLRSYSERVVLGAASAKVTIRPRDDFGAKDPVLRVCCELQYVEPPHHDAATLDTMDDTWEVTPRTNLRVMVYDTQGRVVAVGEQTLIKVGKSAPVTGVQVNVELCPAGGLGEILVIAGDL